jgi:hypothetical protein
VPTITLNASAASIRTHAQMLQIVGVIPNPYFNRGSKTNAFGALNVMSPKAGCLGLSKMLFSEGTTADGTINATDFPNRVQFVPIFWVDKEGTVEFQSGGSLGGISGTIEAGISTSIETMLCGRAELFTNTSKMHKEMPEAQ